MLKKIFKERMTKNKMGDLLRFLISYTAGLFIGMFICLISLA